MQIMTRPPYGAGSDDADYYRTSRGLITRRSHERCVQLATTSPGHPSVRTTCPVVRPQTGNSPPEDDGQELARGHPRRRVGVACARCRKRKIRCSGDAGDGSLCNNCKQAGLEQGQCLFLRVGSKDVSCSPGNPPYPYNSSSANTSPVHGGFGGYAIGGASSSSTASIPPSNAGSAGYNGSRVPNMNSYSMSSSTSRPPVFSSPFHGSYSGPEDETDQYGVVPSQFVLSSNDPYGIQDPTNRGWTALGQGGKLSGSGALFMEPEPPAYASTQLPYLTSTVARMPSLVSTDGSFFPTMTALSSSLPSTTSPGDSRVLPTPKQSSHMGTLSHQSSAEAVNFPFPSYSSNQKSSSLSQSWDTRSSLSTIMGTNQNPKSSSSSASSSQDSASHSSYPPMHAGPYNPATSYSSASTYPTSDPLSALTGGGGSMYSFGGGGSSSSGSDCFKRGTMGGEASEGGTLVSGQQYTRLKPSGSTATHSIGRGGVGRLEGSRGRVRYQV